MPPERAADLLLDGKIQAYLGTEPRFPRRLPDSIRAVESLGSFVIVRINPASPAPGRASACAIVETIVRDMAGKDGFVAHPYPVTPLHGDYLYHVDLAEAAKARLLGAPAASPPRNLKVRAGGALASSRSPGVASAGAGLGCRGRGGRRGGTRRPHRRRDQRLARAALGKSGWFHA